MIKKKAASRIRLLLGCHSACFAVQYINYCVVTAQLLDCKSGAVRAFCVFDG